MRIRANSAGCELIEEFRTVASDRPTSTVSSRARVFRSDGSTPQTCGLGVIASIEARARHSEGRRAAGRGRLKSLRDGVLRTGAVVQREGPWRSLPLESQTASGPRLGRRRAPASQLAPGEAPQGATRRLAPERHRGALLAQHESRGASGGEDQAPRRHRRPRRRHLLPSRDGDTVVPRQARARRRAIFRARRPPPRARRRRLRHRRPPRHHHGGPHPRRGRPRARPRRPRRRPRRRARPRGCPGGHRPRTPTPSRSTTRVPRPTPNHTRVLDPPPSRRTPRALRRALRQTHRRRRRPRRRDALPRARRPTLQIRGQSRRVGLRRRRRHVRLRRDERRARREEEGKRRVVVERLGPRGVIGARRGRCRGDVPKTSPRRRDVLEPLLDRSRLRRRVHVRLGHVRGGGGR